MKKPSIIIKPHRAGLFSLLNNIITCRMAFGSGYADWRGGSQYHPPGCDKNLWLEFFSPEAMPEPPHTILNEYPDFWLTSKNVATLYRQQDQKWRMECNDIWRGFKLKEEIMQRARQIINQQTGRPYISILVRANCHAGEQVTSRNQTLDEYAAIIERHMNPAPAVYVACGDEETMSWFAARFPVICHPKVKRAATRDTDLFESHQTFEDAMMAMEEVLCISMASRFVHPCSNMATAALYINPGLESIYIP